LLWTNNKSSQARGLAASDTGSSLSLIPLHERLLGGELDVGEQLAAKLLPMLRGRLRTVFRTADYDVVNDAAEDALIEYFARPGRFDQTRGIPLDGFLFVIARRRLMNQLRSTTSRLQRERDYAASCSFVIAPPQLENARAQMISARIESVISNDVERAAIRRWLSGQPDTAIAAALGLTALTESAMRQEVKRFKDRVRARLRRAATELVPLNRHG
jgi:DNA-directed RNA polymerase specialized sigma24 family protein